MHRSDGIKRFRRDEIGISAGATDVTLQLMTQSQEGMKKKEWAGPGQCMYVSMLHVRTYL